MRLKNREEEEGEDRLSTLPDSILLHILGFIDTKTAVQICLLLSKRLEKNLWRSLPGFTFDSSSFLTQESFGKFVSRVIKESRKSCHKINSLSFVHRYKSEDRTLLEKVTNFVVSRGVICLKVNLGEQTPKNKGFLKALYTLKSLTTLVLKTKAPLNRSLRLERLTNLHLQYVTLSKSDMFSDCPNLNVLTLEFCILADGIPRLNVFASRLLKLSISNCDYRLPNKRGFVIELRTPRLEFFRLVQTGPLNCSLQLERLTNLHLQYVELKKSDMFSECPNLNVLTLEFCILADGIPGLYVFAARLLKLSISNCAYRRPGKRGFMIVLRTPRLEFFRLVQIGLLFLHTCELSLLHTAEVHYSLGENLYVDGRNEYWCLKTVKALQCLHNAKSVTLGWNTIKLLSEYPDIMKKEPSPFDQLHRLTAATCEKSFDIDADVANYLLKNSPNARLEVARNTSPVPKESWY